MSSISLQGEILSDEVFVSAAERFGKLAYREQVTAEHPVRYMSRLVWPKNKNLIFKLILVPC